MAMAALAETRDNETGHHLQRTKFYIQSWLLPEPGGGLSGHLTPERIRNITMSALLHDIGKVGIPDHIFLNPADFRPRNSADETHHFGRTPFAPSG